MTTFVLAGGCFWCLDAAYRTLRGVTSLVSGSTGGVALAPTYEDVCTGGTGPAEAVALTFDPAAIPATTLLDAFSTTPDPRALYRPGNQIGQPYRSPLYP